MSRVACTIAAANYLPHARVLAQSFRAHNPTIPFRVLLVASEAQCTAAGQEGLDVVQLHDLGIPVLQQMLHRYDRMQISTALKPALLRHLLELGHESAVYLDADILVTDNLAPLFDKVAGHAVTLTPHIGPLAGKADRSGLERILLMAGMYNAGFLAVTRREEAGRFLDWWERRLRTHCLKHIAAGHNYDQRWLDHAIGFVDDLYLLRDPGCNVAYWNLAELDWHIEGSDYRVNGAPLRFFHFSGFDPAKPTRISRYAPGRTLDQLGPEGDLFRRYAALLRKAGWQPASRFAKLLPKRLRQL